jgi:hypothetical protein
MRQVKNTKPEILKGRDDFEDQDVDGTTVLEWILASYPMGTRGSFPGDKAAGA